MLRTFPSAGLEVVKKSLWIRMAFQKSAFQTWNQQIDNNRSDNLRCFLFLWIGQLPVPSCKTTSGASKLDVAAGHSQRQKAMKKTYVEFKFMLLGVVLTKSSNDSRLTVVTTSVVRHVPRASGPFLWELPAKASGWKYIQDEGYCEG